MFVKVLRSYLKIQVICDNIQEVLLRDDYIMKIVTLENMFIIIVTCKGCLAYDEIILCQLKLESILWFHGLIVYQEGSG